MIPIIQFVPKNRIREIAYVAIDTILARLFKEDQFKENWEYKNSDRIISKETLSTIVQSAVEETITRLENK